MATSHAQSAVSAPNWQAGVVLDAAATSRGLELGARDKGLGLGHSDLLLRGAFNEHFSGEAILGFHTEAKKLEGHIEKAWVQTRSLPHGFQARAGRFASQIGYLNELHPHTDDFTERPLLYRGFLGRHWYDDGIRLNWTAPTSFYLRLGAEIFGGKKLVPEATTDSTSRVSTLNLKMGNDIGKSSSWQWGLSHVNNRREALVEAHDASTEAHSHAASFSGKRMWISDLVWKWAPDGNNRNQQLRLNWEYAQVSGINRFADSSMRHRASSLGAVWKFNPAWEAGVRTDWLRVHKPEDHEGDLEFGRGRLKENAIMVAYKPTHMQTLRLQLTQQRASGANDEGEAVFANPARRSIQLQYVIGFGAHGAHSY
ncbi:MAG: hypothetical protein FJY46_05255 [Betaproteobacteria bacterium]|nr:hypothetical protein [Betaproteobacteria bacterium]